MSKDADTKIVSYFPNAERAKEVKERLRMVFGTASRGAVHLMFVWYYDQLKEDARREEAEKLKKPEAKRLR